METAALSMAGVVLLVLIAMVTMVASHNLGLANRNCVGILSD